MIDQNTLSRFKFLYVFTGFSGMRNPLKSHRI